MRVQNPYTGESVAEVPLSSREQIRHALDAGAAYTNALSRHQRSQILFAVAELIAG
ncbi:MAG: aldehyde dehydrogenase family protein, partial [Solirubrobacterales bacterium]|nr:aldehyde dehydrogenase family protein [Solirubrobacterales bacterium]